MHPENLPLLIMLISGLGLGSVIGFLAAAFRINRAVIRRERETWRTASAYFRRRYNLPE